MSVTQNFIRFSAPDPTTKDILFSKIGIRFPKVRLISEQNVFHLFLI